MRKLGPLIGLWGAVAFLTLWSAIHPHDYATWFFELLFGWTGVVVLSATYRRFRFSNLVYVLVACHFGILALGAKYTYAEMPLFNWLKDTLGLARNHYDRVGHFAQGFVPVIITREILIRIAGLERRKILTLLCISVCLAFSAFYEIVEWLWVILFYPHAGPEWLGMQGDPWDAQWDMCMALTGAIVSLLLLSRAHDRSMEALTPAATGSERSPGPER